MIPPPTADEITFCARWADVWFIMAARADELDQFRMADHFRQVAWDIWDKIERRYDAARRSGQMVSADDTGLIDHLLGAGYRGRLWSDPGDPEQLVE